MKQKNYSIRDIDETLEKIRKKWFDDCEILENKIIPAMKLLGYDLSVVEWTRKAFEKIDSAEYALLRGLTCLSCIKKGYHTAKPWTQEAAKDWIPSSGTISTQIKDKEQSLENLGERCTNEQ